MAKVGILLESAVRICINMDLLIHPVQLRGMLTNFLFIMEHDIKVDANLIASYVNGNYSVELYDDGTKIRYADVDEFKPEFPENIDVCITKRCDGGCPYCYEGCTPNESHGSLLDGNGELDEWLQQVKPGTELAFNGNDLTHPHLERALILLKEQGVIVNITANQKHFEKNVTKLLTWQNNHLINGLGISIVNASDDVFYDLVKPFKNVVFHTIAGILSVDDIINLQCVSPRILILGYKNIGRGSDYSTKHAKDIEKNIKDIKVNLKLFAKNQYFPVIAFDNLAIEQLGIKDLLFKNKEDEWNKFYMGDDGCFTFYIDAVNYTYSKNSCSSPEERFSMNGKTLDEMFKHIRDLHLEVPEVPEVSSDESKS